MQIFNSILTWMMKKRIHQIELFQKYPHDVQEELFNRLLATARNTEYGTKYAFDEIRSYDQYKERLPVVSYEDINPYIERLMRGEQNLLWPSKVSWFAKSSGTTNARSKFIPVSPEALDDCHFKGGKDLISLHVNNYPETKLFSGKGLVIGGSKQINQFDKKSNSYYGDVSAVIIKNLPLWAQMVKTPKMDIALMEEWESKIEKMVLATINENVTSISGVPTWTVILLEKILEKTGANHVLEIWPNLELFVHGAVSFTPYRDLFHSLLPSPSMHYMETYNASEGFFGLQDQKNSDELLLMLDYGIFYEFIPFDQIGRENPDTVHLGEVEIGKNYAVVISTNAGLWRYMIGDTVKFTSIAPYRIKITGRTKHFINAFGEELIIENAECAITSSCRKTGAVLSNFTAGPRYFGESNKGCHEWIVEFEKDPSDGDRFVTILDEELRALNSDYDAKRHKDMALQRPIVHKVAPGTFNKWMKKRGKLGGQNKVPRLANNREYLEDIFNMLEGEPAIMISAD